MVKKLNIDEDVVTSFMETGAFDLLTILPHDEVEQYGIDYLHSQFEPNALSAGEQARWVEFWNYYARQWSSGTTTHVSGHQSWRAGTFVMQMVTSKSL
jgi:hypothetical protein